MSELMLDEIHEEKRIKVRSAEIVVHGTLEKPYYEIKYQTTDGEWHIGYSSRKLEHVFWWLDNCFEIISYEQEIRGKTIEEFVEKLNEKCNSMIAEKWNSEVAPISWANAYADFKDDIDEIAEQMKEVTQ